MSLSGQIEAFAVRVGAEIKALKAKPSHVDIVSPWLVYKKYPTLIMRITRAGGVVVTGVAVGAAWVDRATVEYL